MKHASSRDLFAYWNKRRGTRLAPERAEIEPSAIRSVLGDSFILSYDSYAGHPFRLAGTRVCALFGREMKTRSFIDIWDTQSRTAAARLVRIVAAEGTAVVAGVSDRSESGDRLAGELLLLPLYHAGRMDVRVLGILAPLAIPYWLGETPVGKLALGPWRHLTAAIEDPDDDRFDSLPAGGRRLGGLMVYEGGRQSDDKQAPGGVD